MLQTLPSGVVTLLFTDVEGSTRLLGELGDGYAPVLFDHRRAIRTAVTEHDGVEVDTQGDAFFVAFERASDAVAAAVDIQRALADGPIKVRMGLYTGEPTLTEEGYVGLDVHKGARIGASGHGGQVLLSQATRALVDAEVVDLGPHRLKDLSAPERIFQLAADGLPSRFPPLKTLDAGMVNLPTARTSFVGREAELRAIEERLADPESRLLTLVGPGGAGKTRLAIEAAGRRADRYGHGLHFVSLASVTDPAYVASAIAHAIQFQVDTAHSGIPPQDQLLDFLKPRSVLLVLDNFEHLLDAAELVSQIVESAPGVDVIATSRERLGLQAEWVIEVDGLGAAGAIGGDDAMRLFEDRARQADGAFRLTDASRADVSRICTLVGGMPLAIELAAAWITMLSAREIADEIASTISFLTTTARDVPDRHRSLRAVLDHSWKLLTDEQRDALRRLSAFRGSFTREASLQVAGTDLRSLAELVSKSLVRRSGMGRFELHELTRQYAAERLAADAGVLEETGERHARHYIGLVAARRRSLHGPDMVAARDELRLELDNVRVAAEWAVRRWPIDDVRMATAALVSFLYVHGLSEGSRTFSRLLEVVDGAAPSGGPDVRATVFAHGLVLTAHVGYEPELDRTGQELLPRIRSLAWPAETLSLLHALGIYACEREEYGDAIPLLQEADALCGPDDAVWRAGILSWLGWAYLLIDELGPARTAFEAGYEAAIGAGHPMMSAFMNSKLGLLADAEGDFATATRRHLDAHTLFESIGDLGGMGYTASRSSMSAYCQGDYEEALRLGRAGYDAFTKANHRWGVMSALCRIGFASAALGDAATAVQELDRVLELSMADGATSLTLHALCAAGVLAASAGRPVRAAELLAYGLSHPGLPGTYRIVAQPTFDALERRLSATDNAAARATAETFELETLVADVRRELTSSHTGVAGPDADVPQIRQ